MGFGYNYKHSIAKATGGICGLLYNTNPENP
jgi:hypothetical protein